MVRKSNWKNTFGAKAIASVLSAAMAFSGLSAGMPSSTAYAKEDEDILTEEVEDLEPELAESMDEVEDASFEEDIDDSSSDEASAEDTVVPGDEPVEELRVFDETQIDVWDFGAENLGDGFNNRLDVATINGYYKGVTGGSTGKNIASFSVDDGDFEFNDGGSAATHRLRTTNTALTRYDEKSLKDSKGNVYSGYIYSNKGKTEDVYVAVECKADDRIVAYVASNGTDSEVHFKNISDASDDAD